MKHILRPVSCQLGTASGFPLLWHVAFVWTSERTCLRLVELLGVEQFHLLGLSMGGLIALRFYSLWPSLVRTLILSGSYAKAGEESRLRLATAKVNLKKISMLQWGRQY